MTPKADEPNIESGETLRDLLKAGLELGVPEAKRKVGQLTASLSTAIHEAANEGTVNGIALPDIIESAKKDPNSLVQIAKEVWSRGGKKDKERAATAVGFGLGSVIPHRALQLARELAAMARSPAEADVVGTKAIGPILEQSPMMLDRVKLFVQENQTLIRQAAIAGVVYWVGRKRKYLAVGLEVILLVAQHNEKEIRQGVRWALRKFSEMDAKETTRSFTEWVRQGPSAERAHAAAEYAKKFVGDAKLAVERTVIETLARFAESNGHHAAPPVRKGGRKPKPKRAKATR